MLLSSGENLELSQYQTKLMSTHEKQMEIMKKDLDDGYHNATKEFQFEQSRLQLQCSHLKQQLHDSNLTIEHLKSSLNHLKQSHFNEISRVKEIHTHSKYSSAHDDKDRQDYMQTRIKNVTTLLEQSNNT